MGRRFEPDRAHFSKKFLPNPFTLWFATTTFIPQAEARPGEKLKMANVDVMNAMTVAYNAQDVDAMMDLVTDNCIMQKDRGEVIVAGKASIREFYLQGFAGHPKMHLELKNHFAVGTALLVHEVNTGYVVDGKETVFESTWAYQIVDGKIELMHYFSIDYKAAGNVF